MEERHKSSGSIKNLRPLSLNKIKAGQWISRMLEEPTKCNSGTPILDGSNSSDMLDKISRMFRTLKFLTFGKEKMPKLKRLLYGRDTMV